MYSVNLLSSSGGKNSSDPHKARSGGDDEELSFDDSYSTYYYTATATITDHSSSSAASSGGGDGGGDVKTFSVLSSSSLQKSPPPQVKNKPVMPKPISVVKTTVSTASSPILQDLSTMRAATRLSTLTEEPTLSNEGDHFLFEADFGPPDWQAPPVNDLVWIQPYGGRQGRNAGWYIIQKVEMKRSNEGDHLFEADFGTPEWPVVPPVNGLVWL